jgi:hypothetical protein
LIRLQKAPNTPSSAALTIDNNASVLVVDVSRALARLCQLGSKGTNLLLVGSQLFDVRFDRFQFSTKAI